MAKRKYLALLLFVPHFAFASPWLAEEGAYNFYTSAYISSKSSLKQLKAESALYYKISQEIVALHSLKGDYSNNSNLTAEAKKNRIVEIDREINKLQKVQENVLGYYPLYTASQEIEYGASDRYSLYFKAFSQHKKNIALSSHDCLGFEAGPKFKLKEGKKYVISIRPSIGVVKDKSSKDIYLSEIRLLMGRNSKHKIGKAFNTLEIAQSLRGRNFECHMDYTAGLEIKKNITIMLQTYNSFRPKARKVYKQTSLEQLSVAKTVTIGDYNAPKITLQIGYFHEFSMSSRKSIASGIQFSIWTQI